MNYQNGSALLALIAILACVSTLVIIEWVYDDEDMDNYYCYEVEVEDRNINENGT